MTFSPGLAAAVEAELSATGSNPDNPEAVFAALERIYCREGEASFDPDNAADKLARSLVISEAEEYLHGGG